jgi:hypothetical protein
VFTYTAAMGGLVTIVLLTGTLVVFLGPENTGVSFRKTAT